MPLNPEGWGQQTAAAKLLAAQIFGRMGGMRSARRRRRKARAAGLPRPKRRRSTARRARRGRARLVKGSAAARRYMAKIRKMRRRR